MSDFKLKVNVGNANIELEGDVELVQKIFSDLRENGLGKLTSNIKSLDNKETVKAENKNENQNNFESKGLPEDIEFPELRDFVIKGNPKTEVDWLVVYAWYQSNRGEKLFTKEDLRQKYRDTNRYSDSISKKFSSNFKSLISQNFIAAVNDTDYKITTVGKQKAEAVLLSDNSGEEKKRRNNQSKNYANEIYRIVDVDLKEEERKDFREFYSRFNNPSHIDKAVLISYWLKETKQIDEIDKDIMFTMLKTATANTSFDIKGALKNAKSLNKYFISGTEKNKYKLHHIGEDHVKQLLEGAKK